MYVKSNQTHNGYVLLRPPTLVLTYKVVCVHPLCRMCVCVYITISVHMHTLIAFHMYAWIAFLIFAFLREITFLILFGSPGEQKPMVK